MLKKRIPWVLLAAAFLLSVPTSQVLAHDGQPLAPHDVWTAWSGEPGVWLGLGLAALIYASGVRILWKKAGQGRGVSRKQVTLFGSGLLVVLVALVSPVDAMSGVLFTAHMVQHMLLILVAAPLLVAGVPWTAVIWAMPKRWRTGLTGWRRKPALAVIPKVIGRASVIWVLHAGVIWLWHIPGPYEAAVDNELVHALEHASFLGTALLFWWTVARYSRQESTYGVAIFSLFTMALQGGLLGALITFSSAAWYDVHEAAAWGLTALEDQQLAGVTMWVPAGVVYLGAVLWTLGSWLLKAERQDPGYELPPVPQMPDNSSQEEGRAFGSD
jgi:putative membrane protein